MGPISRLGDALSASRPPKALPRQIPASMIPITLVHTARLEPTCRATSRLASSSRIMMLRLHKKASLYGRTRWLIRVRNEWSTFDAIADDKLTIPISSSLKVKPPEPMTDSQKTELADFRFQF